jgi:hypothetical protein
VTFHTVFQDVRPHPGMCIRPEGLENNNDGRGREICSRRQPIGLPLQQLLGPQGDPHFILAIATFPLLSLLRPMVVAIGRVIALLIEGHCYANSQPPLLKLVRRDCQAAHGSQANAGFRYLLTPQGRRTVITTTLIDPKPAYMISDGHSSGSSVRPFHCSLSTIFRIVFGAKSPGCAMGVRRSGAERYFQDKIQLTN